MFKYILAILAFCLLFYPAFAGQLGLERLRPTPIIPFEEWRLRFNSDFAWPLQKNLEKVEQKVNDLLNNIAEPSSTTSLTAAGGLTITSPVMRVQGSGGAVTITANPQIPAGYDGQTVTIIGQSDTSAVTFVEGKGLQMQGDQNFTLGSGDILILVYDKGLNLWLDKGRMNN
jgi:hypothetical protein